MTPNKIDRIPEQFKFEQVKSCPIVVNFKGETVTSDAGLEHECTSTGNRQQLTRKIIVPTRGHIRLPVLLKQPLNFNCGARPKKGNHITPSSMFQRLQRAKSN
jgi:hypothetical protein